MSERPEQLKAAEGLSTKDLLGVLHDRLQRNPHDDELFQGISQLNSTALDLRKEQTAQASEEPVTPPESTAAYWAEKLKKSEQYGLYPGSRVEPDWKIANKTAGELYPWSVGSHQRIIGPQSYYEHLGKIRTLVLISSNGREQLGITKKVGYDMVNPPSLLIIPESGYGGSRLGKERPLLGSDGESSYLLYSHTLGTFDSHGRSGNELGLIMYFSKEDAQKFVTEVEKDPHLLDGMLHELFPNLVGKKKPLQRTKSDELVIAEYSYEMFSSPTKPLGKFQTLKVATPLGEV